MSEFQEFHFLPFFAINQPSIISCLRRSFQGLTLDIDKGNLLRLDKDGIILAASHGTRKMTDLEIERVYGRGRKRHVASDYAMHLDVRDNTC